MSWPAVGSPRFAVSDSPRLDLDEVRQMPQAKRELAKLKEATQQFETVLAKMLVSQMRRSAGPGMFGGGVRGGVYGDMLDQAIAQQMSSANSLGIAKVMYQKLEDIALRQIAARELLSESGSEARARPANR